MSHIRAAAGGGSAGEGPGKAVLPPLCHVDILNNPSQRHMRTLEGDGAEAIWEDPELLGLSVNDPEAVALGPAEPNTRTAAHYQDVTK